MRRREFLASLCSVPAAFSVFTNLASAETGQTAVKARRVGLLSSGAPFTDRSEIIVGLTSGFSKRDYAVGSSLLFERRAAEAHPDPAGAR